MTETAQLADFVLPGVTFYEKGEFHAEPLKPVPWLQTTKPLIQPVGDAMPEWRFMAALSEHLGFTGLSGYSSENEILERVFRDSGKPSLDPKAMQAGMQNSPVSFEKLLEKGFNTTSGKIELYSSWFKDHGYLPLPEAEDACACDTQYPHRLVTGGRVNPFNHSQHRNIPELLKHCPEPEAEISSVMARQLDVSTGDRVSIETKTGKIDLRANVIEGMNPLTIAIPHGWPGKENVNWLVSNDLRDTISGTPAYKAIPCRIRKIDS
jgi:anaerobic selenocysteine-containing dehydrogenase